MNQKLKMEQLEDRINFLLSALVYEIGSLFEFPNLFQLAQNKLLLEAKRDGIVSGICRNIDDLAAIVQDPTRNSEPSLETISVAESVIGRKSESTYDNIYLIV